MELDPGDRYAEGFVRDGAGNLAVHATATFSMIGEGGKAK